jgi:hypothetical protein
MIDDVVSQAGEQPGAEVSHVAHSGKEVLLQDLGEKVLREVVHVVWLERPGAQNALDCMVMTLEERLVFHVNPCLSSCVRQSSTVCRASNRTSRLGTPAETENCFRRDGPRRSELREMKKPSTRN